VPYLHHIPCLPGGQDCGLSGYDALKMEVAVSSKPFVPIGLYPNILRIKTILYAHLYA
jgi:hypothetical protein